MKSGTDISGCDSIIKEDELQDALQKLNNRCYALENPEQYYEEYTKFIIRFFYYILALQDNDHNKAEDCKNIFQNILSNAPVQVLDELEKRDNLPHLLQICIAFDKLNRIISNVKTFEQTQREIEPEEIEGILGYINKLIDVFYPAELEYKLPLTVLKIAQKDFELKLKTLGENILVPKITKILLMLPASLQKRMKSDGALTLSELILTIVANTPEEECKALEKLESVEDIHAGFFTLFSTPLLLRDKKTNAGINRSNNSLRVAR